MKLYRIESGIKIPPKSNPKTTGTTSPTTATMQELKKGESFLIKDPVAAGSASKVMRDFMRRERARDGVREFVSRKIGASVRIWRMK